MSWADIQRNEYIKITPTSQYERDYFKMLCKVHESWGEVEPEIQNENKKSLDIYKVIAPVVS